LLRLPEHDRVPRRRLPLAARPVARGSVLHPARDARHQHVPHAVAQRALDAGAEPADEVHDVRNADHVHGVLPEVRVRTEPLLRVDELRVDSAAASDRARAAEVPRGAQTELTVAERRYAESEVREIFALATSGKLQRAPASPATSGHTLADLQSIAREVGIDPDVVARAAAALDARPPSAPRRSWGMPIEVGRIARLQRNLTDDEWDRLVAALRSTFGARGKVHVQGGLREWSNGNLRAAVEPAEDGGYRLRLGTLKGDAAGINALGLAGIATGAIAAG